MQISLTRNSDGKVVVTPEREDLKAAIVCISSWSGGPDGLVTKALRRVGYGGDFFNVTYPGDLSEYERQTQDVPIGKVQVTVGLDDEYLLAESVYLELLARFCLIRGLTERANLLQKYIDDPGIANSLIESDPEMCNLRWLQFVPFLKRAGWTISDGSIGSPIIGIRYNATIFDGDLDVMFRRASTVCRMQIKDDSSDREYVRAYQQLFDALSEFFEFESSEPTK